MRSRLLRPDPYSSAMARLIAAAFSDDAFILVWDEHDGARSQLLRRAAAELADLRCRVIRASAKAAEELSLSDLLGQVSEQAAAGDGSCDLLERTHRLLTEVGPQLDRVLFMIDDADRLSSSALRFLQLTSRSGPRLRVVLASTPAGAAQPAAPEFKLLAAQSQRISIGP
jgi:type II secretory pathway predicted ATPase ExeA